jgi:hypothetical protein
MRRIAIIAAVCCPLFVGACGDDNSDKSSSSATTGATGATGAESLPQGSEPVKLDPADFTTKVDNPYWPMARGSKWEIRSSEEHVVVTVTNRKKDVAGIDAVVLRDTVTKPDGTLVEVTDDWYAQDSKGNIWYLGEDTKEYENGKVSSTKGSWEHGVNGAYAGIIIPADPKPGLEYRQEYYKGEAEDQAKVLRLDSKVTVPAGTFEDCLETEDTTPLEPDVVELKYYAKGVGPVLRTTAEGRGREELVSFTK